LWTSDSVTVTAPDPDGDPVTWGTTGLPTGAALDPVSGKLTWSPAFGQAGSYPVTVSASDGNESGSASFTITVTHTNLAPHLVPVAPQYGRENTLLTFGVVGSDPDGDPSPLSASNLPAGATFDARNGVFQWTPDFGQAGDHTVTFTMTDAAGLSDSIQVPIHIDRVDRPPVLNIADHQVILGQTLTFSAAGTDPDAGDVLTYSAQGLPQGATLDAKTGLVTWTPGPAQAGDYVIRFSASDGTLTTSQSIFVHAAVTPTPPVATIVLTPSFPVKPGAAVTVHAVGSSIAPITGVTLTLNGKAVTLDASGTAVFIAGAPGKMALQATVTDADGYTASTTSFLKVLDPFNNTRPAVALDPHLALTPLGAVTNVTGSVTSSNLDTWSLALATLGSDTFTTIASGGAPVNGGTLAQIDPGTLPNGFYQLRLTATDIAGRQSSTELTIEVQTSAKPAAVRATDTDLTVTLGGTTVSLTRAYDSVGPAALNTFGPGWRLANRDVGLQTGLAPTGLETYGVYPAMQQGTRLYLTLPDGSRAGFTFAPVAVNLPGQPSELTYFYPVWQADPGVSYQLTSVKTLLVRGGNDYYDQATGRPYNPADPFFSATAYTLTAPDGSQELIGANGIAEQITADGHVLHVSDSGITAQNGDTLRLVHDAQGRLLAAQAPGGETVNYVYDATGRLAEVVSSTRGVLFRYGYDAGSGSLSVAVRAGGGSAAYRAGQPPQVVALSGDFGDARQFDGHPIGGTLPAGGEQDYSVSLSDAEVRSTNAGNVILRVVVAPNAGSFAAAVPDVPGLQPLTTQVAGGRAVALFQVTHGGTYLLRVRGATAGDQGAYTVSVDVAGDVNADGTVDGTDSQLLAAAFGSAAGDANYSFAADLDASGTIDAADRQLLDSNYGFAADSATPTFPNYFAPPGGTVWTPGTGGSGGTGGGTGGGSTGGTHPGPTQHPAQAATPPSVPTPAPVPLAPITNPGFGITNGDFSVTDPNNSGFGWTTRGQVTIASGEATLQEGGQVSTALTQAFFIPAGATTLSFLIDSATLAAAANRPPDAFEVALLDAKTLQPLTPAATGLADTDAFLNVQSDGTLFAGPGATVLNLDRNGGILGNTVPRVVELDVSKVPANTLAVVSFDLLGFGAAGSSVTVSDAAVSANPVLTPVAVDDTATTPENTPVSIPVLQNDSDVSAALDPGSVTVVRAPQHGTATVDPATGNVLYTPAANFYRSDSFTYQVRDANGLASNVAAVAVTVTAVAQTPLLTVSPASGNQDTAIPLTISASLPRPDPNDTLYVEISNLPPGATLSAGTLVDVGDYRLTPAQLAGLTFTSPPGLPGNYTLSVQAVSTQTTDGDTATTSATLPVTVNVVTPNPLGLSGFVVNGGQAQRSLLQTLAVRFNQNVVISDAPNDVIVTTKSGTRINVPPGRYSYDPRTFTLTVNVSGLVTQDGEYLLKVRADAVASASNLAVTLSAGDSTPLDANGYLPLQFFRLLADFNGDGTVDYGDYNLWQPHNSTRAGQKNYDPLYDLNGDGTIDRLDYALWRQQLYKVVVQTPPAIGAAINPASGNQAIPVYLVLPASGGNAAPVYTTNPAPGSNAVPVYQSTGSLAAFAIAAYGFALKSATVTLDGSAPVNVLPYFNANGVLSLPLTKLATLAHKSLPGGVHTIVLNATDKFGNAATPFTLKFAPKDTPPPAPPQPVLVLAGGATQRGGSVGTRSLLVSVTDATQAIVALYRNAPGGPVQMGTDLVQANVPAQFPVDLSLLADGTYTFYATAQDLVGNTSAKSPMLTVTVVTAPPAVTGFGLAADSLSPRLGSNATTLPAVHIVGHTAPGTRVTLTATGQMVTADRNGNFGFSNVPVGYGTTVFTITTADGLGNTGTARTTVIRPAPSSTPPQVAATLKNDTGSSAADGITSDPTLVGALRDVTTVTDLFVSVDGQPTIDQPGAISGTTFTLTKAALAQAYGATLPDGPHTVAISARDAYNNQSAPVTVSLTLDTTAPAAPSQPQLDSASNTATTPGAELTRFTNVNVVTTTAAPVVEISLDGKVVGDFPAAGGTVTAALNGLSAGSHTVTAVAIDVAGNRSPASAALTFGVDLTPPATPAWNATPTTPGGATVTVTGTTEPGVQVQIARASLPGVTVAVATADANGHFTLGGVGTSPGANSFIVTAIDAAGNTSSAPGSYFSTAPDTSPPEVTARLARQTGTSATNDPTVTGTVTAASAVTDFQVSVNGSPFVSALGSFSGGTFTLGRSALETALGRPLADGPVKVQVTATNASGHTSAPVEVDFTLDTARPPTPDQLHLPPGSATGTTLGAFITNAQTLTIFTGLSVTTATVVLYANGKEVARQQGAEPLSFNVSPPDGTVRYVAQAVDAAGNVSFFTAPIDVTFDRTTVPPTVSLDPGDEDSSYGPGANTTHNTVTLDGTAKAGATITVVGTPLVTQADSGGHYSLSGVPVRPGANTLDVRATDAAGNTADVSLTVTMHNVTPPAITLSLVNDTGVSSTDLITSDPTTKAVVDDVSPITQLQASVNGGPWANVLSDLTGDVLTLNGTLLQQINGGPLADGQVVVQVQATDADGNASQPASLQVLLMRTPPAADVAPSLVSASNTGADPFAAAPTTKDNTPEIRLFAARADMVTFYDGGTMIGHAFSTGVAEITTTKLSDGVHDVTATIQDQAGNVSAPTPALVLSVYTQPPTTPTLTLDAAQQGAAGANSTTLPQVTLHGQVRTEAGEPPATVTLLGPGLTTTADSNGNFTFSNVSLALGANTLTAQASDLAGNTSQISLTITRDQLVVRTPGVTGTVPSGTAVANLRAGFDRTPPSQFVNVLSDLHNGSFSFSADRLAQINGAPLSAGPHVLHLVATDSSGVVTWASDFVFTLDLSAQGSVSTAVSHNAPTGLYDYTFTLSGPAGNGWTIDRLSLPVPAGATVTNLTTPAGWSVASTGGGAVVWQAATSAAAVGSGGQVVFGLSSNDAPSAVSVGLDVVNAQAGGTASLTATAMGPTAANGPAVPDSYATDARTPLNVAAAAGVLANDIGSGLAVTSADLTSAWGASVHVSANGSFTWTPGSRFVGLSQGESVIDSFSYAVTDGAGHTGQATVDITVRGLETPPTATNVVPTPSQPSLYVKANATTTIAPAVALAGASDPGVNDTLSLAGVAATSTLGASVHIVGGQIVYDPTQVASLQALAAGQSVTDSFTYTVTDLQGKTASALVQVQVTGAKNPVAVDYTFTITKTGILTVPRATGLLSQDTAPAAGDTLIVDPSQTAALSAGGAKVTLNPDGSFQYDPRGAFPTLGAGATYSDTFTYTIDDNFGSTATATVHITVTGVEDAPVAPNYGVTEGLWTVPGQALTVSAANGLLSQAYSPDTGTNAGLTAFAVGGPSPTTTHSHYGATVTVNPDGSFTYDPTTSTSIQRLTAGGQDVVDTFEYGVKDPKGPSVDPTQTIVIKGGPSPYRFDVVASTANGGQYSKLGIGPSINNLGTVAFEGANKNKQDSLYIWPPANYNGSAAGTPPPALSILGDWPAQNAPPDDMSKSPFQSFGPYVQINDSNYVIAQRALGAYGLVGILPAGLPAVTLAQLPPLTYAEIYFGGNALAGSPSAAAYQIAAGDAGLTVGGTQWGSPNFEDMIFAGMMSVLSTSLVGFAASSVMFSDLMLHPHTWIIGPVWGGVFPSPIDRAWTVMSWNASLIDPSVAIHDLGALALGLDLVPNQVELRQLDADPYGIIDPGVSLANTPDPTRKGYLDFFPGPTAIAALGTSKIGIQQYLVTSNHHPQVGQFQGGQYDQLYSPTGNNVVWPKVGDNGDVVFSTGTALMVNDFNLDKPVTVSGDFSSVGPYPAISHTPDPASADPNAPWVAFEAKSGSLGDGIFVARADDPTKYYKVVGVSNDGHLDPNEVFVDQNHNGQYDRGQNEDQSPIVALDPNGRIGVSENAMGELTVSFFAWTKYQDGTTHYGLETAQLVAPGSKYAPTQPYQDQTISVQQSNGHQTTVTLQDPAHANQTLLPRNDFLGFTTVASEGDEIPGAGKVLPYSAANPSIQAYDPINASGQLVFWVKTDQGQMIVRANPPLNVRGQVAYAFQDLPLSQNAALTDLAAGGTGSFTSTGGVGRPPVIATFLASDPKAQLTDYQATIDWGDGSQPTRGTIIAMKQVGPDVYGVTADHTYAVAGPYVITVYVNDTRNRAGGVGAAFANVVTLTDDADVLRYEDGSAKIASIADRGPAGLTDLVAVDRPKDAFTAQEVAVTGRYQYSAQLSQDNGNSPGEPNVTLQGQHGTATLRSIDSEGTIDLVNFSANLFSVTQYDLTASSVETSTPDATATPGTTVSAGDTYTVTATTTTTNSDTKKYKSSGTSLSWSHTATATTTFQRTGERPDDSNLGSLTDGLMNQNAGVLNEVLTSMGLVGSYTMTGTTTATTTLTETGNAQQDINLKYKVTQTGRYTQTATDGDLTQHQTVSAANTVNEHDGHINGSTGQYSLTLASQSTDVILAQDSDDGSQSTTATGTNTVDVSMVKEGKDVLNTAEFGGFSATVTTTTTSQSLQKTTDDSSTEIQSASASSTTSEVINADSGGDFSIKNASTTSTSTSQDLQVDKSENTNGTSTSQGSGSLDESGTLFSGQYTVTTTGTDTTTSVQVQTDQQSTSTASTTTTATSTETDTLDNSAGDFTIAQAGTSTSTATDNSADQTSLSTVTTTATVTDGYTETGNTDQGEYTIQPKGSFDVTTATSIGHSSDGTQQTTMSGSSYDRTDTAGGGDVYGGGYSLTQTTTSSSSSVSTASDLVMFSTTTNVATGQETSTDTGDDLSGDYTTTSHSRDTSTDISLSTDQLQTVAATSYQSGSQSHFETGNDISGTYTTTDVSTSSATNFQDSTNQTKASALTSFVNSTETSAESGDDIGGTYTATTVSSSQETNLEQSTNTGGGGYALSSSTSTSSSDETDVETGNSITGDYTTTVDTSGSSSGTQLSTDASETDTAVSSSTSSGNSTEHGDSIRGDYTVTGTDSDNSTTTQISTNQSSRQTTTSFANDEQSTSEVGNSITGTYTSTSVSVSTETDLEQSANSSGGAVAATTGRTTTTSN
jgi:YD repeat-containing protein